MPALIEILPNRRSQWRQNRKINMLSPPHSNDRHARPPAKDFSQPRSKQVRVREKQRSLELHHGDSASTRLLINLLLSKRPLSRPHHLKKMHAADPSKQEHQRNNQTDENGPVNRQNEHTNNHRDQNRPIVRVPDKRPKLSPVDHRTCSRHEQSADGRRRHISREGTRRHSN